MLFSVFVKPNEFTLNEGSFQAGNTSLFPTNYTEYSFAHKQLRRLSCAHIYWFSW